MSRPLADYLPPNCAPCDAECGMAGMYGEVDDLRRVIRFLALGGIVVVPMEAGFRCRKSGRGSWCGRTSASWLGAIRSAMTEAGARGGFVGEWEGPDWRV